MVNTKNKINDEPSIKQKEKKYSLSTVLAWLYLKTIGRMLPEKWNQWAESILYYNKVIADNGVQTDDLLESEREKELKDENEKLQEKLKEMNELTEQVKLLGEEKEIFAKFFAAQAQQIGNLKLENEELKSKLAGLKKNYSELVEIAQKRGEEFLAQFKEKSEEILHLNKELIECSKEFANKIEMLSVEIEKKDGKIGSLTQLNEVLEQEKKEMETKNNEQKQTIIEEEKRIREQDNLIKSFHENKDINETVRKENENLQAQKTELKNEVSQLKNESDTKIKQLENELKEKQEELEQAKEKGAELQSLKQQLEKEKTNLNTIEKEKKELESEVDKLQEKSQKLEESNVEIKKQKADLEEKLKSSQWENKKLQKQVEHLSAEQEKAKSVAVLSITDSTKTLNENLTLKNQQIENSIAKGRQQKLKNEQKDAGKKSEGMNKKTKAQAKTKAPDTMSRASTAKSTTGSSKSTFSKLQNLTNKILGNENLDNLLSKKNEELKKSFPEFQKNHFCHNVLEKTIKSLQYQNGYKFKSDKLLALLESNFEESARNIIKTKVNKVVEEVAKTFVTKHDLTQVEFVQKCAKKLKTTQADYQAELTSIVNSWSEMNCRDNDSAKKFVVQKLTEAKMKCFSDKIQQLASSIRDKFLSPDQRMCNQTQGGVNQYQLTEKAKKEYTPNSSMSHTTISNMKRLAR